MSDSDSNNGDSKSSTDCVQDMQNLMSNQLQSDYETDQEVLIVAPNYNDPQPYHEDDDKNIDELIYQ